ncbi:dynamin family protein [Euzebya tangerina]|uniref:dynamin family protein n=1 Tax=Euzebya tangerina TaxID=591198 RepID=UPI000E30C444|nr:dynamin family protein [Euzebya tangerina]
MTNDALVASLGSLRDALRSAALVLPLDGLEEATATRDEAVAQIEDYLLPRLADIDAPLLAVLGGSTGAGKSTLTNSLVGEEVTTAGVLRPTTRAPVLVHHPDDEAWFMGEGVLPDVPRSTGAQPAEGDSHGLGAGPTSALHLVPSASLPVGLALLDSPDIDSVETANHELAAQLLGAADLWMFVTTAARYADAVPWEVLAKAAERAAAVALIVNRIPPDGDAVRMISEDVRRMLDAKGLGSATLFALQEVPLIDGRLTGGETAIRNWLGELVADAEARAAVVRGTVQGAVASLEPRARRVAEAVTQQAQAVDALRQASRTRARSAITHVDAQLGSGVLLRGEVLDRFREQVGTAAWMDSLQRGVGRIRDRITSLFTGDTPVVEAARGRLQDNLVSLIDDAVATSVEQAVGDWRGLPGGTHALRSFPGYRMAPDRIADLVDRWQDEVIGLVRSKAEGKVATARWASLGVNGAGVALMTFLFASTGGLTGGEVAVAGGTAAVSQALLTAVLGEQAVRDLTSSARRGLLAVVSEIAEAAHTDLRGALDDIPDADLADTLTATAGQVASSGRGGR